MHPPGVEATAELAISTEECQKLVSTSPDEWPLASPEEALTLARTLMGLYRRTDFADPALFSTALCAVFAACPARIA